MARKPGYADDVTRVQQLGKEDVQRALAEAARPALLRHLLDVSQRSFGAHTRHYPHTINYPWIADRLEKLAEGSRLLEIGAGANPLPIHFAEKGMRVDTIDNADFVRKLPADETWNEWGFLDYAQLHPAITSHNVSVIDFQPAQAYDAIYSVSVISLMTSPVRDVMLQNCRKWLASRGDLLLAIDLIPGTDNLWNKGGSNEPPEIHGTYHTVEAQLRSLGFAIAESRVISQVWKSRTDLHFLVARLAD